MSPTQISERALAREDLHQARAGARSVHLMRAGMGVVLGLLVVLAGAGGESWYDRALWMCVAMAASALVMLIYLRNATPPRWLAFLFPPIDTGAVTLLAMSTGGADSPVTVVFFLVVAVNGLALRRGPLLASVLWVSAAHVVLDALDPEPLSQLAWGLYLCAYWLCALTTAWVIRRGRDLARSALDHLEERNSVLRTFGQHVSPQVVDALLAQGEALHTTTRNVSVMFLDIRGFTTLSEGRDPSDVVDLLNELFGFMIEGVNRNDGIINKFLGDGFMAVFGAPISSGEDARNAVQAGRDILAELEQRIARGELPDLRVGIGIHHGEAVTGSVGSLERKEYTLIGDVVNVAARVEGLNKTFDSQLLVTEAVWQMLEADAGGGPLMTAEVHPDVELRGRQDSITVYQLA